MKSFIFMVRHYSYYKVEAESAVEARQKLENCEDLVEFDVTNDLQRLEDLQPEFELSSVEE